MPRASPACPSHSATKPSTCRSLTTTPGAPAQLPSRRARAAEPWLERADCQQGGRGREVRHARAREPRRAAHGLRARHAARVLCRRSPRKHDLGMLAQRHRSWTCSARTRSPARAWGAFRSLRSTSSAPPSTRRSAPTARWHCTSCCSGRFSRREAELRLRLDRDAGASGALAHGAQRRAARPAKLEAQSHELGKDILEKEQKPMQLRGNPSTSARPSRSGDPVRAAEAPVKKKTPSGQPSTDEDSLAELALDHPLPKLILEHRALSKLKSTYTDKLPKSINDAPGGCTPRTRRSPRSPAGSRPTSPTCRTSRSARRRPPHPRVLHRAAGREDRVGGLLADRAEHHGAPLRRRACGARSARARTSTARPRPRFSAYRWSRSIPISAASPR